MKKVYKHSRKANAENLIEIFSEIGLKKQTVDLILDNLLSTKKTNHHSEQVLDMTDGNKPKLPEELEPLILNGIIRLTDAVSLAMKEIKGNRSKINEIISYLEGLEKSK